MAKRPRPGRNGSEIQKLLEERNTVIKWLQRLDLAADGAPDAVRDKVRGDYQARLDAIDSELEGFGGQLRGSMEDLERRREELGAQEDEANQRLAESKLRHAVGEFDEAQWNDLHSEILAELVQVREEIKEVDGEIDGLHEIIEQVARGEKEPVAVEDKAIEEEADIEVQDAEVDDSLLTIRKKRQTDAFDELAFLKNVADVAPGPAPQARQSFSELQADGAEALGAEVEAKEAEAVTESGERPKPTKTLKCAECSAMNLPTEWYCESCGAELAAI